MNYELHYRLLMEKSKNRVLDGYVERHHIVPRCLGGTDDSENIAVLTPEEHYLAHQLLIKLHPTHRGLITAAALMSRATANNKAYGWIRRKVSESKKLHRGYRCSDEARARMSAAKRRDSEKIRQQRLGSKHSEETKQKMRGPRPGFVRPGLTKLIWINDGYVNRRISGEVPPGWTAGRKMK